MTNNKIIKAKSEIIAAMIANGELYVVDIDNKEIINGKSLSIGKFENSVQINIKRS